MTAPNLDDVAGALDAAFAPPAAVAVSLRDASLADPLRGCPMDIDGEAVDPGQWKNCGLVDRWGLPPNCPVRPLGKLKDEFYFLNPLGEVHTLTASSSGKGPIDALFAGRSGFLEWMCPRFTAAKDEAKAKVKGYEADEVRRVLFDSCAWKGVFEEEDRIRGRGVWRDPHGRLVYHAGNQVFIDGEAHACGEIGELVYPARPRLPLPADRLEPAGPGSAGDLVLEVLRTWNWERTELDPRLMLGFIMTSMVGGGLKNRPPVYLSGPEGSGKSTLQELVRGGVQCGHAGMLNGACIYTANSSQAGIYQRVKQDSIAVSIDENESSADPRVAQRLLELARIAYSGDKMSRGSAEHVAKTFTVMSSFLFSSIAVPAMDAQDASRMALLVLREFEKRPDGARDPEIDMVALQGAARQLLRRWFDHWDRWPVLLRTFRYALMDRAGHDSRSADTFGTLAAASWLATNDDEPTERDLEPWLEWLDASKLVETAGREKTWRRCFMHMLEAQPGVFAEKGSQNRSVADYLGYFKRDPSAGYEGVTKALPMVGVALSWPKGELELWENARLFVPARHPAVNALFEGTPWAGRQGAGGPWLGVLRQMPRHLWENGKCGKGLDAKASGLLIRLSEALEA